jgi:Heterokaryon incompatibility protein (HET)
MFSSPSYKYLPLKPASQPDGEFRILTLFPGREESTIECTLQHASFNNPPPYEALSYTWGNPKGPKNDIPVRGKPKKKFRIQLEGKRKRVGYNLEAALQQLRDETRPVTLWIDAICIDQSNREERSEQVNVMARIYSQASQVIVWLGETDIYVNVVYSCNSI